MERREFLAAAAAGFGAALSGCAASADQSPVETFEVTKTDAEWRKQLNGDQYQILRKHWTEPPGTSPLNNEHRRGTFFCAGCDQPLFSPIPSSTAAPAGPASTGRCRTPSGPPPTVPSV